MTAPEQPREGLLLSPQRLPRWNELPDLDIYMDQVLSLVSRYLRELPGMEEKGLTASMVNNYVKLGILPPPISKRYNRTHLAQLIIITVLKSVLPIGSIGRIIASQLRTGLPCAELYSRFCDEYESMIRAAADADASCQGLTEPSSAIFRAALRSRAEQALALELLEKLAPEEPEQKK